jgi:NAD(P)-dependent dehydrogenase (short-subunit alcohol dehydrogenase family)
MSTSSPIRAIVTGHTRGLGAALAEQLLARGVVVLGLSRSRHATLKERFPALLEEIELELADPTRVAQWVASDALRSFVSGAQTVLLINNAGMVQPIGPIEGQDATDIATAVSLNVATPLMLASALAAASTQPIGASCISPAARRAMRIPVGASTARPRPHSIITRAPLHSTPIVRCGFAAWRQASSIRICRRRFAAAAPNSSRCAKNSKISSATASSRHLNNARPSCSITPSATHSDKRRWPTFARSRSKAETRAPRSRKTSPFG